MSKAQPVIPGRSGIFTLAEFNAIGSDPALVLSYEPGFVFIVVDPADPEHPVPFLRVNNDVGIVALGDVVFASGDLGDRPDDPGYPMLYLTSTNLYLFDSNESEWVDLNTLFAPAATSPSSSIFWSGGATRPDTFAHVAYVANGLPTALASQVSYLGYPVRFPTASRHLRKLTVSILSNTLTSVAEFSVYVNGVKTAMLIAVGIGVTGLLHNTVADIAINDGDTVGFSIAMPGGLATEAITFTAGVGVE